MVVLSSDRVRHPAAPRPRADPLRDGGTRRPMAASSTHLTSESLAAAVTAARQQVTNHARSNAGAVLPNLTP
jgi:hypothetical protein